MMRTTAPSRRRVQWTWLGSLALVLGAALLMSAQEAQRAGIPEDWSHHRLVFSNPGTFADAVAHNTVDRWNRVVNEPRYQMQQLRRQYAALRQAGLLPQRPGPAPRPPIPVDPGSGPSGDATQSASIKSDWSMLPALGALGAAGTYPAKYGFYPSAATCSDYVVYPTNVTGSATAANLTGYYNLYSSCTAPDPNILFSISINVGSSTYGTVSTSPVLSANGAQVAFILNSTASHAYLVIYNIPSSRTAFNAITANTSNINSPVTANDAQWIEFNGTAADTISSPFYDYTNNVLYVGDAGGTLHKFQNVFNVYGTTGGSTNTTAPTEVTGGTSSSGWPNLITSGDVLSSPVYDPASQNVYVGINAASSGIARIPSTGGTSNIVKSGALNKAATVHCFEIVVDSSSEDVYVFTSHGVGSSPADTAGVFQLAYNFASANAGTEAYIGNGGGGSLDSYVMYPGEFDNNYFTGAANPNLYVCASVESTSSASTIVPTLFRISMSGTFGATVATGPALTTVASNNCSPLTEFYNPTTATTTTTASVSGSGSSTTISVSSTTGFPVNDYIQIDSEIMLITAVGSGTLTVTRAELETTEATHADGATVNDIHDWVFMSQPSTNITTAPISCATGTGCIMAFDVTNGTQTFSSGAPTTYSKALAASGTGGIIIDNYRGPSTGGSAEVYFSALASGSCQRTVVGNTTSSSSTAITATTGFFTAADVGATITGSDIAGSTTIAGVTSYTAATLSKDASGTGTGVTFTITPSGGCAVQASQSAL